jgi:hypothetical protein
LKKKISSCRNVNKQKDVFLWKADVQFPGFRKNNADWSVMCLNTVYLIGLLAYHLDWNIHFD